MVEPGGSPGAGVSSTHGEFNTAPWGLRALPLGTRRRRLLGGPLQINF